MQTRLDRARRRFDVKLTAAEYIDEYARLSSLET
jgi:hypothetical protein